MGVRRAVPVLLAVSGVLLLAAPAIGRAVAPPPRAYRQWTLQDVRPVTGAPAVTAASSVRFVVPGTWVRTSRSAARYRFDQGSRFGCTIAVEVRDRLVVGAATSATEHLRAELPAQSSGYVLDEGRRDQAAWRVVRQPGGAVIRGRYAIRSARLEGQIADAPAVWHEVDMTTVPGGECHSGRYHAAADQIGASLASLARTAVPA